MISLERRRARVPFDDVDASPQGRRDEDTAAVGGVLRPTKSEALRALFWRSEILQVMFWLKGEGFGDQVDVTLLERFLGVDSHIDVRYLDRLVAEGYIERVGDSYRLSEAGAREGALQFAASFEELTKPAVRECRRSSWCDGSPYECRLLE